MGKEIPCIVLKFGGIKSIDFKGNLKVQNMCKDSQWSQADEIAIIEAYNGKFFCWWDQKYVTKQEAIDYIKNYGKENG